MDVTYTALDEATKKAVVDVVYGKSFYGGAANANTKLAGEVIGILSGPTPAEVKSGLAAAVDFIENEGAFISAMMMTALHIMHIVYQEQEVIYQKQQELQKGNH